MKINRKKLELAKARACMGQKEIVVVGFRSERSLML